MANRIFVLIMVIEELMPKEKEVRTKDKVNKDNVNLRQVTNHPFDV